jgi:dipeptidyl-peptidase-4
MNHKALFRSAAVSVVLIAFVVLAPAQQKKRLTFEQIYGNTDSLLFAPLPNIIGWDDDSHYLEMRGSETNREGKLYAVDAKSGREK